MTVRHNRKYNYGPATMQQSTGTHAQHPLIMTAPTDWSTVASHIEHTAVGPEVTTSDARALANEVNVYGFRSAVVTPYHAETVAEHLDEDRKLVVVIGFPYGIEPTVAKLAEFEAVRSWVDEVDLVMNRIAFADGDHDAVVDDIEQLAEAIGDRPLKVILETPVLSPFEIETAAGLAVDGGADVVKTAVGYDGPASPRQVALMRETVGTGVGVKASGGIRTYADVLEMLEAGADYIGTSSGVDIHTTSPFND